MAEALKSDCFRQKTASLFHLVGGASSFAGIRLIASLNLIGCSTGRSEGIADHTDPAPTLKAPFKTRRLLPGER
jgi:hypothetical protein